MSQPPLAIWNQPQASQLSRVLTDIADIEAMQKFLRDVMTQEEIVEISSRLEAAKLLEAGRSYIEVTLATKVSSRTIARINQWRKNGTGGYAVAMRAMKHHHSSHSPKLEEI